MKKQILILTFFVAAILAGNNAFGQKTYQNVIIDGDSDGINCITPVPLSGCTITAPDLHPIQGVYYDYTVDQLPPNASVRWFVVNNADVTGTTVGTADSLVSIATGILPITSAYIDAANATTGAYEITAGNPSTYILDVADGINVYNNEANTNGATATTATISMAWKFFNGLSPNEVLLVAYVEDATGCTDNIAVWRIIPTPAFTLDVAAMDADGDSIAPAQSTDVAQECVSPIEWAIYNSATGTIDPDVTPGDSLIVDYGENWVYFVVNAANYIDSWMPTFQFTYAGGDAIPAFEADWAYIGDATSNAAGVWHDLTGTLGATASNFTTTQAVIGGASSTTENTAGFSIGDGNVVDAAGECIVVRARLDWGTQIEHDEANSVLTFAVDGVSYDGDDSATTGGSSFFDARGYADLADDDCTDDNWDHDWVNYLITPRPQVEEGSPTQEIKTGQGVN